ncbi:unnamed protein product [Clonostachys byssicola]|uniref:feruloyl esterase n=1 Tax=Clonostachys byssicola TaxID=160290 RepID=A0A9N9XYT3_9HYPO|nr:unnamed protein product [Clonostachys byssicola]
MTVYDPDATKETRIGNRVIRTNKPTRKPFVVTRSLIPVAHIIANNIEHMRSDEAPQSIATMAAVATGQYSGGDTSGCGKTYLFQGVTQTRIITSSGKYRAYGVHLPSGYDKNKKYPTILGFHGSSSIGLFFELDTRLSSSKYPADSIVVYPNGIGGAWAGASYSKTTVTEDLQFVWDILTDLRRYFCVDSARIYATGMSIGGGFVDTIACNATVGGEFAAFAPASGSFYTNNDANHQSCKPARVPTPIIEIHGGADTSVAYNGGVGEGGINPAIPAWLDRWAERNQCERPNSQSDLYGGDVHHLSWTCKGVAGALQHYKTDDQKHCWASTEINFSQLAAGDKPTHIEASAIFREFFKNFTRPA